MFRGADTLLAGFALVVLLGCASPVRRVEISLVGIASVAASEPLTLPEQAGSWADGKEVLQVLLSAGESIREAARKDALHVGADAAFCEDAKAELFMLPMLFDREGRIADSPRPASSAEDRLVWFYVAVDGRQRENLEVGKPAIPAYDLRAETRPVCVSLRGRNMGLEGFATNALEIPASEFRRALGVN
jgi:hypothetical protein